MYVLNFKIFLKFSNFLKSSNNSYMQFLVVVCKLQNNIKRSFFTLQTLPWFWSVISSFNQEELSRLLQFTTGCSQLPPEGFAGLNPKFKISRNWSIDVLPMASTWYIYFFCFAYLVVSFLSFIYVFIYLFNYF